MREIYKAGVTPQQKLVGVNNKFGNTGIKDQQGTSRILYDTIKYTTGQRNYRFFEDSSARQFPFTNTGSEGNKLGVGDTMVIAQLLFSLVKFDDTDTFVSEDNLVQLPRTPLSYFNVEIANNQVIKKLTLTEASTFFNKDTNAVSNTIDLETSIVLPPLLPYVVELQLPADLSGISPTQTAYLKCEIIGVGGIIAPRTTF
jgi:hypothetical protein